MNKRERLRANIAAAPVAKLATDLINSWSNQKTDLIKFLPYPGEFDQKPNISPDTARILIGLVQDEKIHPKFAALVAQDWHLIEKIAQD
ncbi:hypothetical protein [Gloeothece verrucosa]|uniref:hypothetical protein n=1 Tax=Gloeothece verrucosa TaxID=2546359 RepID=UPI00031ED128|nr:hypothetical protein [Gloeothece verrucosa]